MSLQLTKADILFRQRVLRQAGFYLDKLDGIYGKKTMKASEQWDDIFRICRGRYGEFDSRTESNLQTVLPKLQVAIRLFLSIMMDSSQLGSSKGFVIKVLSGTRTYAEQDALYAQGRTKPGNRITKSKGGQSNHNFGLAVDIGIFYDGEYLDGNMAEEVDIYSRAAVLSRSISGLARGADWRRPDMPHYELDHRLRIAEVRRRFEKGIPILTQ
jgi:peptidoglycan L-alanyl-D-glutamate endopeptidase CwlK